MKLAITLGGMMAGRRVAADPQALLEPATKLVAPSPQLSKLRADVRERLLDAAKNAAMAAATNKIDSLGESLTKRASDFRVPRGVGEDEAPGVEDAQEVGENAREQVTQLEPPRLSAAGRESESSDSDRRHERSRESGKRQDYQVPLTRKGGYRQGGPLAATKTEAIRRAAPVLRTVRILPPSRDRHPSEKAPAALRIEIVTLIEKADDWCACGEKGVDFLVMRSSFTTAGRVGNGRRSEGREQPRAAGRG